MVIVMNVTNIFVSDKIELNKKVRSYTVENSFITSLQKQLKNSKYLQKIRVGSRDIKVLSDKQYEAVKSILS